MTTPNSTPSGGAERIERTYPADPDQVWQLWTTAEGIGSWWAPDGFSTEVNELDLRPGGELVYAMTATAAPQVEFMTQAGMPLTTVSRKTFTEVVRPTRLAYLSLIDFVPDHEPYQHRTVVELTAIDDSTKVVMTIDPMHDAVWTERLIAGRTNELDNLARLLA